jgi:hypothetical protein
LSVKIGVASWVSWSGPLATPILTSKKGLIEINQDQNSIRPKGQVAIVGELSADKLSADKLVLGELSADELLADELLADKLPLHQTIMCIKAVQFCVLNLVLPIYNIPAASSKSFGYTQHLWQAVKRAQYYTFLYN